jgi:hypothetical protein
MEAVVTGGCLCGAVRYQTHGKPLRTVVCYCKFCQRCTGSALGVWSTFTPEQVHLTGPLSTYEHRSDESGRWIRLNFCAQCGASVTSTFEKGPGEVAILGGTFDDTTWITVDRQVWTRSKQHWLPLPAGVASFEKSSSAS